MPPAPISPPTDRPDVAVVVPARDSAAGIGAALAAILAQEGAGTLEVVVAVGLSRDGTAALVDAFAATDPRVRRVDNPSGTTPAALNRAIAVTTAPVVVRVDAHAVIPPGYIRRAVEVLRATGAANVGGIQDAVGETPFEEAVAAAMRSPLGSGGAAYRGAATGGVVDTVYLGVFRRESLVRVGGFDESLLRNQDYELNIRLRAAGEVVWFDPSLRVRYRPRGSLRALAVQYHEYGRWKREVARRHPGSLRLRQLAPPVAVLGNLTALLLGVVARPLRLLCWVPSGYGFILLLGAGRAQGASPATRRRLPLVLATMHAAWGIGFLRGPSRAARG